MSPNPWVQFHTVNVNLDHVILNFLQRVAIGAGAVLLLLITIRLGMRRRAVAVSRRQTTH
jgi:hypothetical protein